MPEWLSFVIPGLIGAVGIPLILFVWQALLKRERVKKWGYRIGRFLSKVLGQKLGAAGSEKVEGRIKSTISDFIDGVYEGLDEDNVKK